MLATGIPYKFATPWAADATTGYITATIPATSTSPAASQQLGFPPATATPVASGGTPPNIADFNGALNYETLWSQWLQAGGPIFYDSAFSTAIGGYPKGAVLMSTVTTGLQWINLVDNNTTNPDSGGANWTTVGSIPHTWSATQTYSVGPVMNINVGINAKAADGTVHNLISYQTGGYSVVNGGLTGFLVNNYANTANNLVLTDAGALSVRASISVPNVVATIGTIGNLAMPGGGVMSCGALANMTLVAGTSGFAINNNASTLNNFTLTDAGNAGIRGALSVGGALAAGGTATVGGAINSSGAISAGAGNITANAGRLRAGLGAYLSGDGNAATLLNDFLRTASGGNYINERLPDGTILQAWTGTTTTGADVIAFPIAFPSGCSELIAFEGAPGGWDQGTGQLFPTSFGAQALTAANFTLYCASWNGTHYAYGAHISYRYIAIGF